MAYPISRFIPQFRDRAGLPVANGYFKFYRAGTTIPVKIFQTSSESGGAYSGATDALGMPRIATLHYIPRVERPFRICVWDNEADMIQDRFETAIIDQDGIDGWENSQPRDDSYADFDTFRRVASQTDVLTAQNSSHFYLRSSPHNTSIQLDKSLGIFTMGPSGADVTWNALSEVTPGSVGVWAVCSCLSSYPLSAGPHPFCRLRVWTPAGDNYIAAGFDHFIDFNSPSDTCSIQILRSCPAYLPFYDPDSRILKLQIESSQNSDYVYFAYVGAQL